MVLVIMAARVVAKVIIIRVIEKEVVVTRVVMKVVVVMKGKLILSSLVTDR